MSNLFDSAYAALTAVQGMSLQARQGNPNSKRWYVMSSSNVTHVAVKLTEISDDNVVVQATACLPNSFITVEGIAYNVTAASLAGALNSVNYDIERIEKACTLYANAN